MRPPAVLQVFGESYSRAIDGIGVPLYVADADGVCLWANESTKSLLGDVEGRGLEAVVVPEQLGYAREQLARKVPGAAANYGLTLIDKDGNRVPVHIHWVALESESDAAVFGTALPTEQAPAPTAPHAPAMQLTSRQHETLLLLGEGLGTAEIAARLGISVNTTRNHVRALIEALGVHSRIEAVMVGHRTGLLS